MNHEENERFIVNLWDETIIPTLMDYIKIPNQSPLFDPNWEANGYMEEAVLLFSNWCKTHAIPNMTLDIIRLPNRTPVIFIDIPGNNDDTILLYGHLDKQPEMTGWDADLGALKPVLKNNKLYGRGGADDGYALFASFTAIKSLRAQNIPHARCIILIEASEESGSRDLPDYIDVLKDRIGQPNLVICLDSGCGDYDHLWMTTSLRGLMSGILHINVLKEGIHSGMGSGIVPSCFTVLRQLLDRVDDPTTGNCRMNDFYVDIPLDRKQQAERAAAILGLEIYQSYPFQEKVEPLTLDPIEQIVNRTWRPSIVMVGADGLPPTKQAGNVTLPSLSVKLSMRLPPLLDAKNALAQLKECLEKDPPYKAHIHFEELEAASGWNAPAENPWLTNAANEASQTYFGTEAMYMGEGGSIPFMGMLGKKFPHAQFLVTGLLGPGSNAHGPNEFLHIPTAKKLTCSVATIIAHQYRNTSS